MKRKIFFVLLVVLLMVGSILPAFAAKDLSAKDEPGLVTLDTIQGTFYFNLEDFEGFSTSSPISEYGQSYKGSTDWLLNTYVVYVELPDFGVVYGNGSGTGDYYDEIHLYFMPVGDVYELVFFACVTTDNRALHVYNRNGINHNCDYAYFQFDPTEWSVRNYGSWDIADVKSEVAQLLFSSDVSDGSYEIGSGLMYPKSQPVTNSIFTVFSDVFDWLGSAARAAASLFWDSGLTFFGILSVSALGIGIVLLILKKCSDFLHFRS